jgi:hypothetical protein
MGLVAMYQNINKLLSIAKHIWRKIGCLDERTSGYVAIHFKNNDDVEPKKYDEGCWSLCVRVLKSLCRGGSADLAGSERASMSLRIWLEKDGLGLKPKKSSRAIFARPYRVVRGCTWELVEESPRTTHGAVAKR